MTLEELKKLVAARRRGVEAPLLDRRIEITRRPFRVSGALEGVLLYSMTEKVQTGDVAVVRLASGELLAGIYAEKVPRAPNYWELKPKPRRISKRPTVEKPVIRHELRPLDSLRSKRKYTAGEVAAVYPVVDYYTIDSEY